MLLVRLSAPADVLSLPAAARGWCSRTANQGSSIVGRPRGRSVTPRTFLTRLAQLPGYADVASGSRETHSNWDNERVFPERGLCLVLNNCVAIHLCTASPHALNARVHRIICTHTLVSPSTSSSDASRLTDLPHRKPVATYQHSPVPCVSR